MHVRLTGPTAPEVPVGDQLLELAHGIWMAQRVIQATKWRFGRGPLVLALVIPKAPTDIGGLELEDPLGSSDRAIISMRLIPQRLVSQWEVL